MQLVTRAIARAELSEKLVIAVNIGQEWYWWNYF